MYKALAFVAALAATLTVGVSSALAGTIVVDGDGHATPSNCNASSLAYSTIQDAVNFASGPSTTIKVCPGTYTEQVTVSTSGVKLVGVGSQTAVIKAPASMTAPDAIVMFDGAITGASIKNFTVTGPLPDSIFCGSDGWGVKVQGGATATIADNHITQVWSGNTGLRGCQQGLAIGVGRTSAGQIGHATITGNTIDQYQKGGIYVDGAGSSATIKNNTVLGVGTTPDIAQNGIQISRNAVATVASNTVQDNSYADLNSAASAGILLFEANGATKVQTNNTSGNDVNIWLSDQVGMLVKANSANSGSWGIVADSDALNNRILSNTASGNAQNDCEDDSTGSGTAGTGNTWRGNTGTTADPAGICTAPVVRQAPHSGRTAPRFVAAR